jgi:hypothetical protein
VGGRRRAGSGCRSARCPPRRAKTHLVREEERERVRYVYIIYIYIHSFHPCMHNLYMYTCRLTAAVLRAPHHFDRATRVGFELDRHLEHPAIQKNKFKGLDSKYSQFQKGPKNSIDTLSILQFQKSKNTRRKLQNFKIARMQKCTKLGPLLYKEGVFESHR